MLNEFTSWFENQWHVIAPILLSVLPSLGVVGGIVNSAKNLVANNKAMIKGMINQLKEVNEGAFNEIKKQVVDLVGDLRTEINALRNDNQAMAQIISKVILSKSVNNNVKEEILLLAKSMESPIVKDAIVKNISSQPTTNEVKVAEVKEIEIGSIPIAPEVHNKTYIPISE